jgi:hypothetical protein
VYIFPLIFRCWFRFMVFNATFNKILVTLVYRGNQFYWWRKPEYLEKTTWQTLSHNAVSNTGRHVFCSEWTFHHISHLRVRLQCDIALKNPFSQKQSTIYSIYIIICTVSCTKNYHTYFWHVWKYEIKIVYQCNRCVVYQTVLIQAVENFYFSVLEWFITKKDKLRHVLRPRVSFWSAPLLELR